MRTMLPKYAAVKGSLGPEIRWWTRGGISKRANAVSVRVGVWMCNYEMEGCGFEVMSGDVGANKACLPYCIGPIRTPHAARKRRLPIDHLE